MKKKTKGLPEFFEPSCVVGIDAATSTGVARCTPKEHYVVTETWLYNLNRKFADYVHQIQHLAKDPGAFFAIEWIHGSTLSFRSMGPPVAASYAALFALRSAGVPDYRIAMVQARLWQNKWFRGVKDRPTLKAKAKEMTGIDQEDLADAASLALAVITFGEFPTSRGAFDPIFPRTIKGK